jgi:hypothetical protein
MLTLLPIVIELNLTHKVAMVRRIELEPWLEILIYPAGNAGIFKEMGDLKSRFE